MKLIVIKTYLKEGQSSRELYTEFVEFAKSGRVETNKCRAVVFINQGETEVYVETCRLLPGERLAIGMEIDNTHIEQTFRVWEPLKAPTMRTLLLNKNIGGGEVIGAGQYAFGQEVTIEVITHGGYNFIGWYVDGNLWATETLYTFNMPDEDMVIEAHFEEQAQYTLSVGVVGSGNVVPSEGEFPEGYNVSLQANPDKGYRFDYWADGMGSPVSNKNPYTFDMPAENVILQAYFSQIL